MSAIITDNHKVFIASMFKDALSNQETANVYLTFGYHIPWSNDAAPQQANTSYSTHYEIWRNMIGAKRLTGNDIQHVIRRYDWAANTVYTQYDQANTSIGNDNVAFYVVNSEKNVYKCLYNAQSANSTVEPTAINANNVTQTADGYIWKFMYKISTAEQIRFMTDAYMPVKKLTENNGSLQWQVQQNATDGALYAITITDGGSGYTNASSLTVTITGDGSLASATANINVSTNTVSSITVTNPGSGYTNAAITISGGGGTGATARALIGPKGGHGSNPVYELHGKNVLINGRLINNEGNTLSVDNEFRQIAIIKDPMLYDGVTPAANSVYKQTLDLTVSGTGTNYNKDEDVYQGASLVASTFRGKVVEYDTTNTTVKLTNVYGTPINDPLIGNESSASKFVTSIDYPELELNSGEVLYVDNILPITRNIDQTEDFKIVVKF